MVGCNEVFAVGDHDFSKMSFIPDAVLLHDIPERKIETIEVLGDDIDEDISDVQEYIGSWYRGHVYYGVKNMILEGSTAIRGVLELSKVISGHCAVPPRIFAYTDGGGDRRTNFLSVQKSIILLLWLRKIT